VSSKTATKYRRYAMAYLLSVNLLNCIDRQVLYAGFPLIKADLKYAEITVNCSLLTHEEADHRSMYARTMILTKR
jgi:hypothetical protein